MAQLAVEEIKVGTVSHLDQSMLTDDPDVLDTYPQQLTELRPFLCVAIDSDRCTWAPLSSTFRRERLKIIDEWRLGGLEMWRDRVCYLCDGANLYIGPVSSFVRASNQDLTDSSNRASVAPAGVDAVLVEIEKQKRRRVNGREP